MNDTKKIEYSLAEDKIQIIMHVVEFKTYIFFQKRIDLTQWHQAKFCLDYNILCND